VTKKQPKRSPGSGPAGGSSAGRRRAAAPRAATVGDFQAAAKQAAALPYELCLYIAGTTASSSAALTTLLSICHERLAGRFVLSVVDVYQEPERAKADQIIAVPTLLKRHPQPSRRLIGDLSDRAVTLAGLGLKAVADEEE
jgi:circadian clock protein KaiB